MNAKSIIAAVLIVVGVVAVPLWIKSTKTSSPSATQAPEPAPASAALPKFINVGTTTCAPCKAMLGIITELKQTYTDVMDIEFINITRQPAVADRYGVQIIPTQIFYAPDGSELFRNTGVLRTEQVLAKWTELGYPMKPSTEEQ